MTDIFEKGIDNLDNKDPIIVLCGEVGSMVGRFVDGDVSESETTKKLIDIYHTKFEGDASHLPSDDVFEDILNFIKSHAGALPEKKLGSNNKLTGNDLKIKDILLKLLYSLENDDAEHIYDTFTLVSFSATNIYNDIVDKKFPRPSMTLNEVISPSKMNVDEVVEDKEDKTDNVVHHPLWYVLNKVEENQSEKVEVENDKESSDVEKVDFYGKEVSVGDKTKINFVDEKEKKSSVSMGADTNSINIAHKKKDNVSRLALNTTFFGVLDYMSANDEVPFDFVINTKTNEFKKEFVGSIIMYFMGDRTKDKIKDNDIINGVSKESLLAGKISSFVIDGVKISYNDFSEFKNYEDFMKFVDKVKGKENETETVRKSLLENEMINNVGR